MKHLNYERIDTLINNELITQKENFLRRLKAKRNKQKLSTSDMTDQMDCIV